MPIYKGTTELTKIADFLTTTEHDITEVYFGDKQVFTAWEEYDGTLPTQYSANGSMLADYRVYGSAGGVGDKTENLFDKNATDTSNGYVANKLISKNNGSYVVNNSYFISEYISVLEQKTYVWTFSVSGSSKLTLPTVEFLDDEKNVISVATHGAGVAFFSFTTPTGCAYIRASVQKNTSYESMLTEGSTAPVEYVPYGYEVDMSVSDGTTSTTIPIYIGSDPLGEDEYVSFKEQKVYRRTENLIDVAKATLINISGSVYRYGVDCGVLPQETYTFTFDSTSNTPLYIHNGSTSYTVRKTDLPYNFPANGTESIIVRTTAATDEKSIAELGYTNLMLVEGSTATYIPYLQPTDPPVPLPALPTVDGTTITDYAGQSAAVPSRFYAKYRKEGF